MRRSAVRMAAVSAAVFAVAFARAAEETTRKPASATKFAGGAAEPRDAPLAARLVLYTDSYRLDPETVKKLEEYRTPVEDRRGRLMGAGPAPPDVDMVYELKNTGAEPVAILIGGDICRLELKLEGPGAMTLPSGLARTMEFRMGRWLRLEPGAVHAIPIRKLSYGTRGDSKRAYWTKPGDYKLTATYVTAYKVGKDAGGAPPEKANVKVTTAPAEVKVTENGKKDGEKAAKEEARQGVRGVVEKLSGNFMPGPGRGAGGRREPLSVPVHVFKGKVKVFVKPDPKHPQLVAIVKSGKDGRYKVPLEPGEYTVVAEIDGKLYLNIFTGAGFWPTVKVKPGEWTHWDIQETSEAAF